MEENFSRFGASGETVLVPAAAIIVSIAIISIFLLPRRYAAIPILTSAFTLPGSQVLVIGGFHFLMARVIILFDWLRFLPAMTKHSENEGERLNSIDRLFLYWGVAGCVAFWTLWDFSSAAFVN